MEKYKSFVKMIDIPEKFDYDIDVLKKDGYKFKGRFNKTNPDFEKYCKDLRNERKEIKIINLNKVDKKVDLWAKK